MKRIGSSKKPLVLRAQTAERAGELLELCNSRGFHAIVGIEDDKPEDISDLTRRLARTEPPQSIRFTPARNAPCPCQSGSKYKNCCGRQEG